MLNEKIVTMFNKKVWGKGIKILNYNEFDVFNVEILKEKMPFVFNDETQTKNCKDEDLQELEQKLNILLDIISNDLHYPKQNIKFYKSTPIDPINPDLLHLNCYFTPAKLERKYLDGYNKDRYYEFQNKMSYEEYLDTYSTIVRTEEPQTRNEEEAEKFIKDSILYKEYIENIKDDSDFEQKENQYIELTKSSAKKDLEMIDINDKYIEGYSFKWCNGLYVTLALL